MQCSCHKSKFYANSDRNIWDKVKIGTAVMGVWIHDQSGYAA